MTKLASVLLMALAAWGVVLLGAWLMISPAKSHYHIIAAPVAKALGSSAVTGGSSAGAAVMGGGLIVAGAVIAWCGANQPKRNLRRDTFVDGRHDVYPTHNYRQRGCMNKGKDPRQVRPATKLWPNGK